MSKIWLYIKYILKVEKVWGWPKLSDVIIFDAAGKEVLMHYLHQYNPQTLDVNNSLYMPVFISSFFRGGKRDYAYIDCFIKKVNPKIIITFIDNNPLFYLLKSRHPSIKTIFIQNGVRTFYADCFEMIESSFGASRIHFKVDHMLTFGSNILEKYKEYVKGQGISIGSIKNNENQIRVKKIPNSIGFVSQFRRAHGIYLGGNYIPWERYATQMDKMILLNLVKYAENNNNNFFIIPCTANEDNGVSSDERAYYESIAGRSLQFYEGYQMGMNSYDGVDSAEVVVGIDSALLYESAARNNKTAIFSFRGSLLGIEGLDYGWPRKYANEGEFWSNRSDYDCCRRIMNYLFAINQEDWVDVLRRNAFSDVMNYDPGNKILQTILDNELKI